MYEREVPLEILEEIKFAQAFIEKGLYGEADRSWDFYVECCPVLPGVIERLKRTFPGGIRAFDAGCGTGRAYQGLVQQYPGFIDADGATLNYYPPSEPGTALPKEKITVGRIKDYPLSRGPVHLITAVGSLEITDSHMTDGIHLLELLDPEGYLSITETCNIPSRGLQRFMDVAQQQGLRTVAIPNSWRFPTVLFTRVPRGG